MTDNLGYRWWRVTYHAEDRNAPIWLYGYDVGLRPSYLMSDLLADGTPSVCIGLSNTTAADRDSAPWAAGHHTLRIGALQTLPMIVTRQEPNVQSR